MRSSTRSRDEHLTVAGARLRRPRADDRRRGPRRGPARALRDRPAAGGGALDAAGGAGRDRRGCPAAAPRPRARKSRQARKQAAALRLDPLALGGRRRRLPRASPPTPGRASATRPSSSTRPRRRRRLRRRRRRSAPTAPRRSSRTLSRDRPRAGRRRRAAPSSSPAAKPSGAVVEALGVRALAIGPEIDPGVPWTRALGDRRCGSR